MNKAVMISIQPYYVFLIIARMMGWDIPQEKTVEIRKNYPKDSAWNKRTYIYCSINRKSFNRIPAQYQPFMAKFLGKVIGSFVCDRIYDVCPHCDIPDCVNQYVYGWKYGEDYDCLTFKELKAYLGTRKGYGWHITDLKIYDEPKELSEFIKPCIAAYPCRACYFGRIKKTDKGFEYKCCRDFRLTRPPQSWCYVEEM